MFSYGRGRGQQTLIAGPDSVTAFIPLFFLLYLICLPLTTGIHFSRVPLYAYLALDFLFSIQAVASSGSLHRLLLFFLFPVMHLANGFGLLYGLLMGKVGVTNTTGQASITISRIKEFGQSAW